MLTLRHRSDYQIGDIVKFFQESDVQQLLANMAAALRQTLQRCPSYDMWVLHTDKLIHNVDFLVRETMTSSVLLDWLEETLTQISFSVPWLDGAVTKASVEYRDTVVLPIAYVLVLQTEEICNRPLLTHIAMLDDGELVQVPEIAKAGDQIVLLLNEDFIVLRPYGSNLDDESRRWLKTDLADNFKRLKDAERRVTSTSDDLSDKIEAQMHPATGEWLDFPAHTIKDWKFVAWGCNLRSHEPNHISQDGVLMELVCGGRIQERDVCYPLSFSNVSKPDSPPSS